MRTNIGLQLRLVFLLAALSWATLAKAQAVCPSEPGNTSQCETITNFATLRQRLANANGQLTLCAGSHITKTKNEAPITLEDKEILIQCAAHRECSITGPGQHIEIVGFSEVSLSGIEFNDATDSAIMVQAGNTQKTTICHCSFNRGNGKGAGIFARLNTMLSIHYSTFKENVSDKASGIYTIGEMEISHTEFINNEGPAIFTRGKTEITDSVFSGNTAVNLDASAIQAVKEFSLILSSNTFANNSGRVILIDSVKYPGTGMTRFIDGGGNIASGNSGDDCSEIYDRSIFGCAEFIRATGDNTAGNPTIAPTASPTSERTFTPTTTPTVKSTDAPTENPTSEPTNAPTNVSTSEPTNSPTPIPTPAPMDAPTPLPTPAPTDAPTPLPKPAPIPPTTDSIPQSDICPSQPGNAVQCETITEFYTLMERLTKTNGQFVLCAGSHIIKSANENPIILEDKVLSVQCAMYRECSVTGPGNHIEIKGGLSEVTFSGIEFSGATESSVMIEPSVSKKITFCHCAFSGNEKGGSGQGASIFARLNTFIQVHFCTFQENMSRKGSAVHSAGQVDISFSEFIDNTGSTIFLRGESAIRDSMFIGNQAMGRMGPGIHGVPDYSLVLFRTSFVNNVGVNGPIVVDGVSDATGKVTFVDEGGNQAVGNEGDCNEIFDRVAAKCETFLNDPVEPDSLGGNPTTTPSSSPSISPSSSPNRSPSSSPTLSQVPTTSQKPSTSQAPSKSPSQGPTTSSAPTVLPSQSPSTSSAPSTAPPTETPSISSSPSLAPSSVPTVDPFPDNPVPSNPPKGYFNYNPNDKKYGPDNWKSIKASDTEQYAYWSEFAHYVDKNLDVERNYCGETGIWRNSKDKPHGPSPLDVTPQNKKYCQEYHEIRDRAGDWRLDDVEVQKQFFGSKIRVLYPRRTGLEPDPPNADIPLGWQKQMDVVHIDLKTPSEHTLNGTRYAGEYQVFIMSTAGRGAAAVSILMDLHPKDKENEHFEILLDEFKLEFTSDLKQCLKKKRKEAVGRGGRRLDVLFEDKVRHLLSKDGGISQNNDESSLEDLLDSHLEKKDSKRRRGQEFPPECADGTIADGMDPCTSEGNWDPWHEDIMRSYWFYSYEGSLTEPPCYPFVGYRVIDLPMLISRKQLNDLKTLLFLHKAADCTPTSTQFNQSVARPLQSNDKVEIHRCTCMDFLSDQERDETGINVCPVEKFCEYHDC